VPGAKNIVLYKFFAQLMLCIRYSDPLKFSHIKAVSTLLSGTDSNYRLKLYRYKKPII